jgi:hypothetical protein
MKESGGHYRLNSLREEGPGALPMPGEIEREGGEVAATEQVVHVCYYTGRFCLLYAQSTGSTQQSWWALCISVFSVLTIGFEGTS